MPNKFAGESGVMYIGPRAFVVGFAVLCAAFAGIAYGASRITESLEAPQPLVAAVGAPAAAFTTQATGRVMPSAPPTPTPTPAPAYASAPANALAPVMQTPRPLASPLATPRTLVLPRPRKHSALTSLRPAARRAIGHTQSPLTSAVGTPLVKDATPVAHITAPRVPASLARAPKAAVAVTAWPRYRNSPTPTPRVAADARRPSALLVPFTSRSRLTPISGLEPRVIGGAPLIVTPLAKP